MDISRCMIVAQKEFADQITGKRFFAILALFLIITALGMHQGIEEYTTDLTEYQEKMVAAESHGLTMGNKPSILSVFSAISDQVVIIGGILAISIGFDLVSKEKETQTLKMLLSHPIYRDEVINGKAIAGGGSIALAIGLALLVSLAMCLLAGILPTIDEFSAILTFGAVTIIFLLIYFTLALTVSTLAPDSGSALIATLIIFIVLSSLLPLAGETAVDVWAGKQPEPPYVQTFIYSENSPLIPVNTYAQTSQEEEEAMTTYEAEAKVYYEKKGIVTAFVEAFSPQTNYKKITSAIIDPYITERSLHSQPGSISTGTSDSDAEPPHFLDVLGELWGNIALLLILPGVCYLLAYVCFMRIDVR